MFCQQVFSHATYTEECIAMFCARLAVTIITSVDLEVKRYVTPEDIPYTS